MTEEELDAVRESARKGEPKGEYELAMLYAGDYFKQRAIHTLRALYKGILRIYESAVAYSCHEAMDYVNDYLEAFKSKPSVDSLNGLIVVTLQTITSVKPVAMPDFTASFTSGIASLGEALPLILDRHYPEWRKQDDIQSKVTLVNDSPTIETVYDLLNVITASVNRKGTDAIINKLLADALCKGFQEAVTPLAKRTGYKTKGVVFEQNTIVPVYDVNDNNLYPAICLGMFGENIKVTDNKFVRTHRMLDYFTPDASCFSHYISVVYDISSKHSRDAGFAVLQSVLASVLAWIGPQKFTLDVIDYEHTGIGAYPAQYLPEKQVKIISRDTDWNTELDSLEHMIEKRSRMMQSIMEYNRNNPDMIEPYKVVIVQDYDAKLISANKPVGDHPDQKEKDRYELELKNAKRFIHLLERGYRYGLIFIVGSKKNAYRSSLPVVDCTGTVGETYPTAPYSRIRVDGVSHNDPDWLMKWLSGGEEIKARRQRVQAGEQMDGADGILTTEVADDGTEVEFLLDTVSHTHAFVIGKTGSGKSVLLHNVITGLVNAYGPDDLMLYLLDLKMGGVEFNRYRRLPHLRSLLVDNSDIQIVLEIMRDIDVMMRERGKAFRDAGVSNVKEYNRANPQRKMSQVIVVIDECHAIFSMGGSARGASKSQREITERLAKIAKEGRSQGIHLIFATQTLSGSEIPPDIQKNITDYYLLKCAPSDSESLVRDSSSKTEALPVGKVYYYHADKQALFQGTYNDNQACEELISESLNRYAGKKSHGQFYFNGAQTFTLNSKIVDEIARDDHRGIHGSPGRMINLQQTPIIINLNRDYSENVLLTGINSEEQLSRTTLALMVSQMAVAACRNEKLTVNVINCLDGESTVPDVLREMADTGHIRLYSPSGSEELLKRLCDQVSAKTLSTPTLLYVYGQERFGELKRNQKFSEEKPAENNGTFDIFQGISFSTAQESSTKHNCDSFRKALIYLLENGPLAGLNTVIQLDKPDKLLFDEYTTPQVVSSRFKHIIILRSESRVTSKLPIDDDTVVETLSADVERLRAYYYCDDDGSSRLFSPYELPTKQLLENLTANKEYLWQQMQV